MRTQQRLHYVQMIERVVQYLQNIDWSDDESKSDLATLASIARLSPYHFHRIFRLITGEPVGDLVRRLRVARALLARDAAANVTERAMVAGYATPQSFARAVRDIASASPSALLSKREIGEDLLARLSVGTMTDAQRALLPLSIEITSIDPFTIQAIRNVGAYRELNSAYEALFATVFAHAPAESLCGIYGVPLDDPLSVAPQECRFYCGVRLNANANIPEPVRPLQLGGGPYVVARHRGNYDLVHDAIDMLFGALMDCDAVSFAHAPIHVCYLDDPETCAERELRADIFIPVESGAIDV